MAAVSMKDVLAFGGLASQAAMQAGLPNPLRNLNMDKFFRDYGETSDLPEDVWFTMDEVQEHDQARERQRARQQDSRALGRGAHSRFSRRPSEAL